MSTSISENEISSVLLGVAGTSELFISLIVFLGIAATMLSWVKKNVNPVHALLLMDRLKRRRLELYIPLLDRIDKLEENDQYVLKDRYSLEAFRLATGVKTNIPIKKALVELYSHNKSEFIGWGVVAPIASKLYLDENSKLSVVRLSMKEKIARKLLVITGIMILGLALSAYLFFLWAAVVTDEKTYYLQGLIIAILMGAFVFIIGQLTWGLTCRERFNNFLSKCS